jgi:hypothetical protein
MKMPQLIACAGPGCAWLAGDEGQRSDAGEASSKKEGDKGKESREAILEEKVDAVWKELQVRGLDGYRWLANFGKASLAWCGDMPCRQIGIVSHVSETQEALHCLASASGLVRDWFPSRYIWACIRSLLLPATMCGQCSSNPAVGAIYSARILSA